MTAFFSQGQEGIRFITLEEVSEIITDDYSFDATFNYDNETVVVINGFPLHFTSKTAFETQVLTSFAQQFLFFRAQFYEQSQHVNVIDQGSNSYLEVLTRGQFDTIHCEQNHQVPDGHHQRLELTWRKDNDDEWRIIVFKLFYIRHRDFGPEGTDVCINRAR